MNHQEAKIAIATIVKTFGSQSAFEMVVEAITANEDKTPFESTLLRMSNLFAVQNSDQPTPSLPRSAEDEVPSNSNKPETVDLAGVLDEAQDAFWAVIAKSYPECTTGDFPPSATFAFDDACKDAATTWLLYNKPDDVKEKSLSLVGENHKICEATHIARELDQSRLLIVSDGDDDIETTIGDLLIANDYDVEVADAIVHAWTYSEAAVGGRAAPEVIITRAHLLPASEVRVIAAFLNSDTGTQERLGQDAAWKELYARCPHEKYEIGGSMGNVCVDCGAMECWY